MLALSPKKKNTGKTDATGTEHNRIMFTKKSSERTNELTLLYLPAVEQTTVCEHDAVLVLVLTDLWELFVDLLHNEFIHLLCCGIPFVLSRVFLLPENPLQRPLQVRQPVLVLQVVRGAYNGVHEGEILHPQLQMRGRDRLLMDLIDGRIYD